MPAGALTRFIKQGLARRVKSTLGISNVYLETLDGLAEDLEDALTPEGQLERAACPACAYREEGVTKNARYLLDEIAENQRSRERYLASPGLCFRHFDLVWRVADPTERTLILDVQRRSLAAVADQLREHVHKQGEEFRHEPKGAEQDSWLRAIYLTGGWPPDHDEDLTGVVTAAAGPGTDSETRDAGSDG